MKNIFSSLIVVAGIATASMVVSVPLSVTAAHAKTCKAAVSGAKGHASSKGTAQKRARINWRSMVRVKPGYWNKYANWDKASNRKYWCGKSKKGLIGTTWSCKATANPCA